MTGCCRTRPRRIRSATSCATTSPMTPRPRSRVVVPDAHGLTPYDLDRYAADLSRVPDVSAVSAPSGTFVGGTRWGRPRLPPGSHRAVRFSPSAVPRRCSPIARRLSSIGCTRYPGRPAGRSK